MERISIKLILESENSAEDGTTVIVPGSFKPPHRGHLDMIRKFSSLAPNVVVMISNPVVAKRETEEGKFISPKVSKKIFDMYLDRCGIENVKTMCLDNPSVSGEILKYIGNHDGKFAIGTSTKDDPEKWDCLLSLASSDVANKLLPFNDWRVPTTSGVSATDIRNNITNPDEIRKYFPDEITDEDFESIMSMIS